MRRSVTANMACMAAASHRATMHSISPIVISYRNHKNNQFRMKHFLRYARALRGADCGRYVSSQPK